MAGPGGGGKRALRRAGLGSYLLVMLSQKARYALQALIELGRAGPDAQLTAGEIAARSKTPRKFLEAILLELARRR